MLLGGWGHPQGLNMESLPFPATSDNPQHLPVPHSPGWRAENFGFSLQATVEKSQIPA